MKGILFTEDMFCASITGIKTETRRTGGLNKINESPESWKIKKHANINGKFAVEFIKKFGDFDLEICWARYFPGEIVYLKEPFALPGDINKHIYKYCTINSWSGKWQNKLFMPAAAARYFIRIKEVHAEQLNDITKEGAIAEGIEELEPWPEVPEKKIYKDYTSILSKGVFDPIYSYISLFASINGKKNTPVFDSVVGNPWVFVYHFELVDTNETENILKTLRS
jgi:hypothetical protein